MKAEMVRAVILTLGHAALGTLLSSCDRQADLPDCLPYTTSEYQRRQDVVAGAASAKQRYDSAVSQHQFVDDRARAGDDRAVRLLPGMDSQVKRLRSDLDRANTELDQVNNETPLCPSPGGVSPAQKSLN